MFLQLSLSFKFKIRIFITKVGISHGIPSFNLCLSDLHANTLTRVLGKRIFGAMKDGGNELEQALLRDLVEGTKKEEHFNLSGSSKRKRGAGTPKAIGKAAKLSKAASAAAAAAATAAGEGEGEGEASDGDGGK